MRAGLRAGWQLWLMWVAASVAGFALIGVIAHFPGSFPVGSGVNTTFAAGSAFGLAVADASGLLRLPWTPAVGAQQHALVSGIAGLVWGALTGGLLVRSLRSEPSPGATPVAPRA